MSLFQIFEAFEKYSLEIVVLAFPVVLITSFIKKVIFRNKLKKIITLIPFFIGIGVYALYLYLYGDRGVIKTLQTVENGFKTGGLGTVYYVFYEQFIRGKRELTVLSPATLAVEGILSNIVVKELIPAVAESITKTTANRLNDYAYCRSAVYDCVNGKLTSGVTDAEVMICAKLIYSTLNTLT